MTSITLGSSFRTGTSLMQSSSEWEPQQAQSQSRVITCEGSTAYKNQKEITDLKSPVEEGGVQNILKNSSPKRNWWAPLFSFSSDSMWSSIIPEAETGQVAVTIATAGITMIQGESISLSELIASKQLPTATAASGVTLIRSESTSLPVLILSSQQKPVEGKKQVVFDDRKARELRRQLRVHETWHDGWVHSAIATRLAEPEN